MTERDGRRRPSLTRWLTDKVEGLAGGKRQGPPPPTRRPATVKRGAAARPAPPRPAEPSPAEKARAEALEKLQAETKQLAKELNDAQVMLMGKEAEFKNDLQEANERNAELLDKVVKLTHRDRELQAKIVDAQFDGSGAKAQLKKLDMELRDLRRSHLAKEQQVAELTEQLEAARAAAPPPGEAATPTAEEAEREQAALRESLDKVATLTRERDSLGTRLADAEAKMNALRDKLANARSPIEAAPAPTSEAPALGPVQSPPPTPASDPRAPGCIHLSSGPDGAPLKAEAAGKRADAARRAADARALRGAVADRVLARAAELGGIARLPTALVERIRAAAPKRSRSKSRSKSRSRSRDHARDQGPRGRGRRRNKTGRPPRSGNHQ